jgi:hypothetical protein
MLLGNNIYYSENHTKLINDLWGGGYRVVLILKHLVLIAANVIKRVKGPLKVLRHSKPFHSPSLESISLQLVGLYS